MNRSAIPVALLFPNLLIGAESPRPAPVDPTPARSWPLGQPGVTGHYQLDPATPAPASVVRSFTIGFGPTEPQPNTGRQWLGLAAVKANGATFRIWLLCDREPPASLAEAQQTVHRYILQEGATQPLEFKDRATSRAALPITGAWRYLLPRAGDEIAPGHTFPKFAQLLGKRYRLQGAEELSESPAPPEAQVLSLRSDALIGVPSNTRQSDNTRRFDGSDYTLVRLTSRDYDSMISAGMNCFNADPEQRRWLERRNVYYWGGGMSDLLYPECLYRGNYLGPALFLDEPAVGTRDYVIRPRLQKEPALAAQLTPQIMLDAFREHFHQAKYESGAVEWHRALSGRPDVDLGDMHFLQENLFTWETMISTGLHQLMEGGQPPPAALVFEPPGHVGTRRTLPELDMTYGCQIPTTDPANLTGILYGLLRGAARLSGRDWGTSIYGAVDRTDSPWLLTHAYDLGARLFFFWDTSALACVPFGECLSLSRHLQDHIESCPHRDLARLKNAAEVLLLFPPGYNLGHVHLGKGSLWGLGELNLERTNQYGVTYRTVMHNLFTEVERCIRLGIAYDLAWDLPGSSLSGYREIVRVREDGKILVQAGESSLLLDHPRAPDRSPGLAPKLQLQAPSLVTTLPARIEVRAQVKEGSAPVYYTPRPNRNGVFENALVFWELFGPQPENYRALLSEGVRPQIHQEGASTVVTLSFAIARPGFYRLRAAVVDEAGRSTVVWNPITVSEKQ